MQRRKKANSVHEIGFLYKKRKDEEHGKRKDTADNVHRNGNSVVLRKNGAGEPRTDGTVRFHVAFDRVQAEKRGTGADGTGRHKQLASARGEHGIGIQKLGAGHFGLGATMEEAEPVTSEKRMKGGEEMTRENAIFYAVLITGIITVMLMWSYGEWCEKRAEKAERERRRREEAVVEIPFEEIIRLIWETKKR